jgi:hypothetical protein
MARSPDKTSHEARCRREKMGAVWMARSNFFASRPILIQQRHPANFCFTQ